MKDHSFREWKIDTVTPPQPFSTLDPHCNLTHLFASLTHVAKVSGEIVAPTVEKRDGRGLLVVFGLVVDDISI